MKEIRKGTEFDEDMKNKKDGVREREVEIKGWSERKGGRDKGMGCERVRRWRARVLRKSGVVKPLSVS